MPKKNLLPVFITAFCFVVVGSLVTRAQTVTPGSSSVSGWAWSDNIGWISFGSSTPGSGGGSYGVYVKPNGDFDGYAWSSSIGWIKFGSLSGMPNGGVNAHVDTTSGQVTGWIRACAATTGNDCISPDRGDGWDGWIELSGPNHTSPNNGGVTFNPTDGSFSGYAWGSDVVGWLKFDSKCTSSSCSDVVVTPATLTCSVSSTSIYVNQTDTITATILNGSGAYTYQFDPGDGTGIQTNTTGSLTHLYTASSTNGPFIPTVTVTGVSNLPSPSSCSVNTGVFVSDVVIPPVSSAPTVNLKASNNPDITAFGPYLHVPKGSSFDIAWTRPSTLTKCTALINPSISGQSSWDVSAAADQQNIASSISTVGSSVGTYKLTLACTKPDGSGLKSAVATLVITDTSIIEH